jgi:hypothetical protein
VSADQFIQRLQAIPRQGGRLRSRDIFGLAKEFVAMPPEEIDKLLDSPAHEGCSITLTQGIPELDMPVGTLRGLHLACVLFDGIAVSMAAPLWPSARPAPPTQPQSRSVLTAPTLTLI